MQSKDYWETIYATRDPEEVSWFQNHAQLSLQIIRGSDVPHNARIIDVGGGASTLVDGLLDSGYEAISVLDLSGSALSEARERLGPRASTVQWLEADVLEADLPVAAYDVWHDRAVFHFLTYQSDRHRYVNQVLASVKPGGLVVIATFAEDGPEECSGLPVMRFSPAQLHAELGESFILLESEPELHITPAGQEQSFIYCSFMKSAR